MIRQFDFIFEFAKLKSSSEIRIDIDWIKAWADKFIANFRANSNTNDVISLQIQGDKIVKGAREIFVFSLLVAASVADLKRSFRAQFRDYFVGASGVRLVPFFKREARAFNSIVSSFSPGLKGDFIDAFEEFRLAITKDIEPESRESFAQYLINLNIWNISIENSELDIKYLAKDETKALQSHSNSQLLDWEKLAYKAPQIHQADIALSHQKPLPLRPIQIKEDKTKSTNLTSNTKDASRQDPQTPMQKAVLNQKNILNGWHELFGELRIDDGYDEASFKALQEKTKKSQPKSQKQSKPKPAKKQRLSWGMGVIKSIFKKLSHLNQKRFGKEFKKQHYSLVFKENEDFWLKSLSGNSRAEIFLSAFAMIEGLYDYRLMRFEQLEEVYSNHISLLDTKGLKKFAIRLCNLAQDYYKLAYINDSKLYTFDSFSKRLFNVTHRSDQRVFTPLVLLLFRRTSRSEFRTCAGLIEKFYLFRMLCGRGEDLGLFFWNIFENLKLNRCQNITLELKKRLFEDRFVSVPKRDEVLEALKNMRDNFYARYVLYWMELYLRKEHKKWRGRGLAMQYTLEHILPQAYRKHWSIKDESTVELLIYQIGNMTLLQDELNVAISNLGWLQKRTIMRLDREPMLINQSILELPRWSSGHIMARTKWLSELFVQIWQPVKD